MTDVVQRTLMLVALASLAVGLAGCGSPPPQQQRTRGEPDQPRVTGTSPERWEPAIEREGEESIVVTTSVPMRDGVSNARRDALAKAMRQAMERVVMDILRDPVAYQENRQLIERRIIGEANEFLAARPDPEEFQILDDGQTYAARFRFELRRDALETRLQNEGLIREERRRNRVIVVIYHTPHTTEQLIDTLGNRLTVHFNDGGFEAVRFDEIRTDLQTDINVDDQRTMQFFDRFVANPRMEYSDDYEGGIQLLRQYGAIVVGFEVANVTRSPSGNVQAQVYGVSKVVSTGQLIADAQETASQMMNRNSSLQVVTRDVVWDAARQLADPLLQRTHDYLDRQERLMASQGREIRLVFRGYPSDDQAAIGRVVRDNMGEAVQDMHQEGGDIVALVETARQSNDIFEDIRRELRVAGVEVANSFVGSRAQEVVFQQP